MRSNQSSTEIVRRIEAELLEKLHRLFGPATRLARSPDVEVIHQMRVNSRRLRVGLRFFASLFPPDELRQVLRHLRRVTRVLGAVRTLDVNAQYLRRAARHLGREGARGRAAVADQLRTDRVQELVAVRELFAMLLTSRFPARVEAMIRGARAPSEQRLRQAASGQLRQLRQAVKKRLRQYERQPSSRHFHRLRIAVKHYRYGLTTAAAVGWGERLRPRIRAVEELQDVMGAVHDAEVAAAYVAAVVREKTLAIELAPMLDWLQFFEQKRLRQFGKIVGESRSWLKKAQL